MVLYLIIGLFDGVRNEFLYLFVLGSIAEAAGPLVIAARVAVTVEVLSFRAGAADIGVV